MRMALGAQPRNILSLVETRDVTRGSGVADWTRGCFCLTRLMAGLVFGCQCRRPLTYGIVAALLVWWR